MNIKCNNCNKIIENVPINWNRNERCLTCNGYFTELTNVNQNQYPSISGQLNEIGKDMRENIGSIPHIIIGKDRNTQQIKNNQNLNTQNPNLGYPTPKVDKGYELFEKLRRYGLYAAIIAVIGYAIFRLLGIFLGF